MGRRKLPSIPTQQQPLYRPSVVASSAQVQPPPPLSAAGLAAQSDEQLYRAGVDLRSRYSTSAVSIITSQQPTTTVATQPVESALSPFGVGHRIGIVPGRSKSEQVLSGSYTEESYFSKAPLPKPRAHVLATQVARRIDAGQKIPFTLARVLLKQQLKEALKKRLEKLEASEIEANQRQYVVHRMLISGLLPDRLSSECDTVPKVVKCSLPPELVEGVRITPIKKSTVGTQKSSAKTLPIPRYTSVPYSTAPSYTTSYATTSVQTLAAAPQLTSSALSSAKRKELPVDPSKRRHHHHHHHHRASADLQSLLKPKAMKNAETQTSASAQLRTRYNMMPRVTDHTIDEQRYRSNQLSARHQRSNNLRNQLLGSEPSLLYRSQMGSHHLSADYGGIGSGMGGRVGREASSSQPYLAYERVEGDMGRGGGAAGDQYAHSSILARERRAKRAASRRYGFHFSEDDDPLSREARKRQLRAEIERRKQRLTSLGDLGQLRDYYEQQPVSYTDVTPQILPAQPPLQPQQQQLQHQHKFTQPHSASDYSSHVPHYGSLPHVDYPLDQVGRSSDDTPRDFTWRQGDGERRFQSLPRNLDQLKSEFYATIVNQPTLADQYGIPPEYRPMPYDRSQPIYRSAGHQDRLYAGYDSDYSAYSPAAGYPPVSGAGRLDSSSYARMSRSMPYLGPSYDRYGMYDGGMYDAPTSARYGEMDRSRPYTDYRGGYGQAAPPLRSATAPPRDILGQYGGMAGLGLGPSVPTDASFLSQYASYLNNEFQNQPSAMNDYRSTSQYGARMPYAGSYGRGLAGTNFTATGGLGGLGYQQQQNYSTLPASLYPTATPAQSIWDDPYRLNRYNPTAGALPMSTYRPTTQPFYGQPQQTLSNYNRHPVPPTGYNPPMQTYDPLMPYNPLTQQRYDPLLSQQQNIDLYSSVNRARSAFTNPYGTAPAASSSYMRQSAFSQPAYSSTAQAYNTYSNAYSTYPTSSATYGTTPSNYPSVSTATYGNPSTSTYSAYNPATGSYGLTGYSNPSGYHNPTSTYGNPSYSSRSYNPLPTSDFATQQRYGTQAFPLEVNYDTTASGRLSAPAMYTSAHHRRALYNDAQTDV